MNAIPLVNNNSVNDINTSLIAIKKNLNNQGQLQDVDVNVGINIATNCTYCAASSTTIKGAQLYNGCSIKVLFTSAITGSDTTTPMSINYNDVSIPVKTGKNGVLSNFVANNIGGSYIYCQAYTTLELLFDGSQFIIMGNPVAISSADYTIYTDGSIKYNKGYAINNDYFRSNVDLNTLIGLPDTVITYALLGGNNPNEPTSQNGFLTVYNSTTRQRITQTYKSNQTSAIFERISDNGITWNNWKQVQFI